MNNKFNKIFDNIKAEEIIKENTFSTLKKEIEKRNKTNKILIYRKFIVSIATFLLVFFISEFSYNSYFKAVAFVDIDVNPSVELIINRFDKVVDMHSYNEDGSAIVLNLNLKYKNYDEAIKILLDSINEKGYIKNYGLVSVTLQSKDKSKENIILTTLRKTVNTSIHAHNSNTNIEVYTVSNDVANHAHDLNISPAKYIAILELQKFDIKATIDNCKDNTISEIRELAIEHSKQHHEENEKVHSENHH